MSDLRSHRRSLPEVRSQRLRRKCEAPDLPSLRRQRLVQKPTNEGSLRLMRIVVVDAQDASRTPEARAKHSATKTGRPAHPRVRAALFRTARAPRLKKWRRALSRRRQKQYADGTLKGLAHMRPFTPDEIGLLGTDTDQAVADASGRDVPTVRWKRRKLGISAVGGRGIKR
jgi:hypothetical protein